MSHTEHKDSTHVAAGLKAAMHNPRVSDEAKSTAQEKLIEMTLAETEFELGDGIGDILVDGKKVGNIVRGYKATLNNPRVSDEAKEHAVEFLRAFREEVQSHNSSPHNKNIHELLHL